MKKLFLSLMILLLCGCSVVRIDTSNIDNILKVILTKDNKLFNQVGEGYKYYLPGGVTYINSDDLNDILYSNGVYYYLYIDSIDYYYNKETSYKENSDYYYSKYLKKSDGFKYSGYLQISEYNDKYLIEFLYNHAKIEALVDENEINDTVLNASYILSTIKYNYDITKLMLEDDFFTNKTGKYNKYEIKEDSKKFVLEKYNTIEEG